MHKGYERRPNGTMIVQSYCADGFRYRVRMKTVHGWKTISKKPWYSVAEARREADNIKAEGVYAR